MIASKFDNLTPDGNLLPRLVAQNVDDSMLYDIASADYQADIDAHFAALKSIVAGKIATPMKSKPKEVLELVSWSEPDDSISGRNGERDHWMRIFACVTLIHASSMPNSGGSFLSEDSTVAQLVDSALKLGSEVATATLKFLRWCIEFGSPDNWVRPYYSLGILLVLVWLGECDSRVFRIMLTEIESSEFPVSNLLGHCQKANTWKRLSRRILVESGNSFAEVRKLGLDLLGHPDNST